MSEPEIILQIEGEADINLGGVIPSGSGEANDIADAGLNVHESLVPATSKVGATLQVKGLRAGAGVTLTDDAVDNVVEISAPDTGNVTGPVLSTTNAPAVYADATGQLLKDPDAPIDMAGQNVTNVGNVDGRDVSADGSTLDTHVADLANPHATTAAQVGADPAGSAATVQTNLTTHIGDSSNPHLVTAAQTGADPAGSAAAVQTNLNAHVTDTGNPHSTTAAQVGADPAGTGAAAVAGHEASFDHANLPTTDQKAALDNAPTAPTGANPLATVADLPVGGGDVSGPGAVTANDNIALWADGTGQLVKDGPAIGSLATSGALATHIADTGNPHSTTAAQVGAIPTAEKGAANGVATLDASGLIPNGQLPPLAISNTFVVASQAAQTALTAETGDVAIRTDEGKSYILRLEPPTNFLNWEELVSPGTGVTSVNGDSGPVVALDTDDVPQGVGNLYYDDALVAAAPAVVANTAHTSDINNPHNTDVGNLGSGTLAELNAAITDATLIDTSDTRIPTQDENDALAGTSGAPGAANAFVTDQDPRVPSQTENDAMVGTQGAPSAANPFVTDQDTRIPTADEKDALAGTDGAPSAANRYVTSSDPRVPDQNENDALQGTTGVPDNINRYVTNSDPRFTAAGLVAHAANHENGGSDEINVAGLSGLLADPQTPISHAATHQNGGSDEINVAGLSGVLADPQTAIAHALGSPQHVSDTLANLNALVSDATLLDVDDGRIAENTLVYRPAGPAGGKVFDDWPTLMTELDKLTGFKRVVIDNRPGGGVIALPAGTYDFTDTTLAGRKSGASIGASGSQLNIPEGTVFTGLRSIEDELLVNFTGTTPPISDFAVGGSLLDVFTLRNGARISSTGAGPLIQCNIARFIGFKLLEDSAFAPGAGGVVNMPIAGTIAVIWGFDGALISANTIQGIAGTTLLPTLRSPSGNITAAQAGFAGTVFPFNIQFWAPSFSDANRGAAGQAGRWIYNTTDGNLNIDNGTNWILPDGTVT